jgi:SseB protein N-terminal domain
MHHVANDHSPQVELQATHMANSKHPLRKLLNTSTPTAPGDSKEVVERLNSLASTKAQQMHGRQEDDTNQPRLENAGHEEALEVFVPVASVEDPAPGEQEVRYEVRQLSDGKAVLPIYTSEALVANSLGDDQSYARIDIIRLLRQIGGRIPLVVNPVLTSESKV